MFDHGRSQPLGGIQRFIGKTVAVCNPALVDCFVFQRYHAHHLLVFHLNNEIGASGIVRADGLAARQLPSAGAIAKRLAGERAHWANVDHVARQLGVNGLTQKGFNLGVLAPVRHAQLHHAGHFLAKAHAAGAMNAAAHFLHADQRAHVLNRDHALFFSVARVGRTVAHRQVLQLAFAALVANRAVQRVVDKQKLHHRLLRLDSLVGLGAHHHALGDRRGAGGHGLGGFFNVHQAHAAVSGDAELLVVAEMGNVGARFFGRMHDHAAFQNLYLLAVEFDFNHGVMPIKRKRRPRRSCALRGKQIRRGSA